MFATVSVFFRRRRRSRLCEGPREVALRLLWWSYLSRWWLLATEAADDPAQVFVARFGYYVELAVFRWTNMHVPSRLEKKRYRFVPRGLCGQRRVHRGILVRPHYATDFIRKRFASQLKFPIKHGKGKNGTSSAG